MEPREPGSHLERGGLTVTVLVLDSFKPHGLLQLTDFAKKVAQAIVEFPVHLHLAHRLAKRWQEKDNRPSPISSSNPMFFHTLAQEVGRGRGCGDTCV